MSGEKASLIAAVKKMQAVLKAARKIKEEKEAKTGRTGEKQA